MACTKKIFLFGVMTIQMVSQRNSNPNKITSGRLSAYYWTQCANINNPCVLKRGYVNRRISILSDSQALN